MDGKFKNPAKSSPDLKKIKEDKKPQRKAEKKRRRMKWYSVLVDILHALFSLAFLVMLFRLNIFPILYAAIATGVVILCFVITVLTQRGKKASRVLGRIYAVIAMLVLLAGGTVLGAADYILTQITDAPLEKEEKEFDLFAGGGIGSISEESFQIYVKDKTAAESVETFCVVHPETRQLLTVTTPGTFYATIPGVTSGQRDWISNAWEHGPETAMETLGNLYETDIDHYLELDSAWMNQMKKILGDGVTVDEARILVQELPKVNTHLRTSLSKYEVQQLIRAEFQAKDNWTKQTEAVVGISDSIYTFSSPDEKVPVMLPNAQTMQTVKDLIDRVEDGELLQKKDGGQTNRNSTIIIQ